MEASLFISHSKLIGLMDEYKNIKDKGLGVFLLKALCFLMIVFLLDFSIGTLLKRLYNNQKSGLLYRGTYSLDSTKADILIFGASRANHHYIPKIFENRLHLTCYNTGRDGETIFYNYAVLKTVLERYTPKIVILDFSRGEFQVGQNDYDRLSALFPYYQSHKDIRPIVELKGPFEKFKLISKIYPYNSLLFTILIGTTKFNETRDYIDDENGYVPLTDICNNNLFIDTTYKSYNLDSNKIKIFKDFVQDCVNADVKLYIIWSPVLIKYLHPDPSVLIASEFAEKNHVPIFSYLNDTLFFQSDLFADLNHLNDRGAQIFTNEVIDSIIKTESIDKDYRRKLTKLNFR